ncbi:MAG: energy-coupling factor transporter transmembrane protein EcfT [Bacilli bacterium]|nr:energy-coupling factor transporter transmembrane protein EcfT [Bacilli bacterium]
MNIALGKYLPFNTIIHRLDPRLKILVLISFLVIVFLPLGLYGYIFFGVVLLSLLLIAKVPFKSILKSIKAMLFMMVFLFVFNIFFIKTGEVLISIGNFKIYEDALYQSLLIFTRLVYMISITTILTSTTKPLDLTSGLEFYLNPLKVIKFPSHEIAMVISLALRFIPTILEEAERIMKAQASRGVDLKNGKLKEKISAVVSLIIPLLVSEIQRSTELANAMEARGYDPSKKRTKYRVLRFGYNDLLALIVVIIIITIAIVLMNYPIVL